MKALLTYPAVGLMLGLADPLLGHGAQHLGMKPGMATALSVNVLLPIAVVALAIASPRLWRVWLGAVSMTLGFGIGLAVRYHGDRAWSASDLWCAVPPVLVFAGVGYVVLGTIAALLRLRLFAAVKAKSST
jgi:hypothetical protein